MTINRLNQGTTNQVLVKAISGQTTNLLELQDSSGNVVSSIGPTGALGGTVSQPQGLVHINTTSFSAVASQSVNDVFSSTYDNYKILITLSSSMDTEMLIRLRANGSDNTVASSWFSQRLFAGSTTVSAATENKNYLSNLPIRDNDYNSIDLNFYRPFLSVPTLFTMHNTYGSGFGQITLFSGSNNQSSSFDGFTISKASGTISGVISIYGFRKS